MKRAREDSLRRLQTDHIDTSSLRTLELELDDEALAKLDEIWPGPGGTAPETYAW